MSIRITMKERAVRGYLDEATEVERHYKCEYHGLESWRKGADVLGFCHYLPCCGRL